MKKCFIILPFFVLLFSCNHEKKSWIRINQLGYRPFDIKTAVYISKKDEKLNEFRVVESRTGRIAMTSGDIIRTIPLDQFKSCYRLRFTGLKDSGTYYIEAGKAVSPDFRISRACGLSTVAVTW
jgi:hypothetical protein